MSVLAVVLLLVGCGAQSQTAPATPSEEATTTPTSTPIVSGSNSVELALVTSGLTSPIGIVNAGDGSGRLFVVQRRGEVRVIDADGTLRAEPFVDLSDRIETDDWERGLLGLAFHPDFADNGRLFVQYTRAPDGMVIISELAASADRASADPASERVLLAVAHPAANHNGGQVAFGRDGYLYIGLGDGGGAGDPLGNGQSLQTLLGKILRIDVDGAPAPGEEYAIPNSNPYAAAGIAPGAGSPEIWVYGLRNPWRFSFDRSNGDLYIGDPGQATWEEIDLQPAGSPGGENYGWNAFEGSICMAACSGVSHVPPIAEYGRDRGCAVIGGYVYRGSREPALKGFYLFGDYCTGTIFVVPGGGGSPTPKAVADTSLLISSFGEDEDGEVYLVDVGGGGLYRVMAGG